MKPAVTLTLLAAEPAVDDDEALPEALVEDSVAVGLAEEEASWPADSSSPIEPPTTSSPSGFVVVACAAADW